MSQTDALRALLVCAAALGLPGRAPAESRTVPQWVWHDEGDPAVSAPAGERFFRKAVVFDRLRVVKIDITADDEFVLYLNGKEVGRGDDWHRVRSFEVTAQARSGTNVLAVKVRNRQGPAGLLVRGYVGWANGTQWTFHSDGAWRSSTVGAPGWERPDFDDAKWPLVKVLGPSGKAGPWRGLTWESGYSERFVVPDGFRVEVVAPPALTGSLQAMTFDSRGRPTVAREGGPVSILEDTDGDGHYDRARPFGPEVKDCQGLCWVGRSLYTAGRGPKGDGLYRLSDDDGDDRADRVELLTRYRGGMGGHGPHGITLGPDGRLYHMVGNHAFITEAEGVHSPVRQRWQYEGNLLPRYEDPRGHAAGIRVPGGTVWRLDPAGRRWDVISAGLRNPYDLAFNAAGDLLTFEADMEWNVGLPWYRPVRVLHCIPGGEFGWRSGTATWPAYYPDSLPALRDTGRGSPTGVAVYRHHHYPAKYRDTLWLGDWTNGLILVEHLRPSGASYTSTSEVFVRGEPMNVTDLEVGPDGNVYFCTGGWGTEGGVYRITWTGAAPARDARPRSPVEEALRQPQPLSAWGRARVEQLRQQAGAAWAGEVATVAADPKRSAADRVRAVDLLQIHGPPPAETLALKLAADVQPAVRARAAPLLGEFRSPKAAAALVTLLGDPDLAVRRRACEALLQLGAPCAARDVLPLLAHRDRHLRFAARLLLQRLDPAAWETAVLNASQPRLVSEGLLALATAAPGKELDRRLGRCAALLEQAKADNDTFLDALRVAQVLLLDAREVPPAAAQLRKVLATRFPTGVAFADREMARLLAHLQAGEATPKLVAELLRPGAGREEQIHLALCLRFLSTGWTPALRRQYVEWFEGKHHWEGGFSFGMYLQNMLDDVAARIPAAERKQLLRDQATRRPFVAAALVRSLSPPELTGLIPELLRLHDNLNEAAPPARAEQREDVARLAGDILQALGRCSDVRAKDRLRRAFTASAANREQVLRALAVTPEEKDWPLFVEGLSSADLPTVSACVGTLTRLQTRPTGSAAYRALLQASKRLGAAAGPAVRLHNRWANLQLPTGRAELPQAYQAQKAWFERTFPGQPLTTAAPANPRRWKYEELLAFATQSHRGRRGNVERGRRLFEQSQCSKCHRFEGKGNGLGPDLTTLGKRFQREDILKAIYYPSRDLNDQYRSVVVELQSGLVLTGMQGPPEPDQLVLLLSDGTTTRVRKSEVAEIRPSKVSIMPEGGLDVYGLDEIADLLAFLESGEEKKAPPPRR